MDPSQRRPSTKVTFDNCDLVKREPNNPIISIARSFLGPAEDYSKKAVKAIAKEEESAKVKALKASAKGTKSIASFFAKKT